MVIFAGVLVDKYKWIVYLTTNLINKMIYIGVRHNKKLNPYEFDGYYGTNTPLKADRKKYGDIHFKRETLFVFDIDTEAYQKEAEIVDISFVNRKDTYNIQTGGTGGRHQSEAFKKRSSEKKLKYFQTDEGKKSIEKMKVSRTGMVHTKEHCEHIRKSMLGKNTYPPEIIEQRRRDIINEPKTLGWKSRISKKWNVTKAAVGQFVNAYVPEWTKTEIIKRRIRDIEEEPKTWGWRKRLSAKWGTTARGAHRFIQRNAPEWSQAQIAKQRIKDIENEPKIFGWPLNLSKKWGVSPEMVCVAVKSYKQNGGNIG